MYKLKTQVYKGHDLIKEITDEYDKKLFVNKEYYSVINKIYDNLDVLNENSFTKTVVSISYAEKVIEEHVLDIKQILEDVE